MRETSKPHVNTTLRFGRNVPPSKTLAVLWYPCSLQRKWNRCLDAFHNNVVHERALQKHFFSFNQSLASCNKVAANKNSLWLSVRFAAWISVLYFWPNCLGFAESYPSEKQMTVRIFLRDFWQAFSRTIMSGKISPLWPGFSGPSRLFFHYAKAQFSPIVTPDILILTR